MRTQIYSILITMLLSIGTLYAQGYQDDLYRKKGEITIVEKKARPEKPARVYTPGNQNTHQSELVESYDEALQRRMDGYLSSTRHPKEFWDIQQKYVEMLAKKYDETFYNILVVNDKIWVEPRYITSMFDESDPVGDLSKYAYTNTQGPTVVNVKVNLVDPWYSSWYGPRYSSFGYLGWRAPYWGGGYYSPYWHTPYWGGGYYPPYWGGGYYPPYWGGGYYPPYWGGGYYPHHHYDSRPRYYGGNYYNSNNSYRPSNGFGRPTSVQNRPVYSPNNMTNQTNVRRYNNDNTRPGGTTITRPNYNNNNSYERPNYNNNNRYERPSTPSYNTRPTRESTPVYTPQRSTGGGGGGGGGFGGGSRRTR